MNQPRIPSRSLSSILVLFCLIVFLPVTSAIGFGIAGPQKFDFLPLQTRQKIGSQSAPCNETLAAYVSNYTTSSDFGAVKSAAYDHEVCLLGAMDEGLKAYLGTAAILLGLSPVLLSTIGPTISEVGLLSMERPVLALLVSAGSAAFCQPRLLDYSADDAAEMLTKPTVLPASLMLSLHRKRGMRILISAIEYTLAAVAGFNVLWTSWQLGSSTILSFEVHNSWLPLFWTVIVIIIHLPIALAFRVRRFRDRSHRRHDPVTDTHGEKAMRTDLVRTETSLCLAHPPLDPALLGPTPLGISLYYLASFVAFVHIILGTMIFSSLLFAAVLDAAVIILRYVVSVTVCRLILIFEIGGLKWATQREADRKKDVILGGDRHGERDGIMMEGQEERESLAKYKH